MSKNPPLIGALTVPSCQRVARGKDVSIRCRSDPSNCGCPLTSARRVVGGGIMHSLAAAARHTLTMAIIVSKRPPKRFASRAVFTTEFDGRTVAAKQDTTGTSGIMRPIAWLLADLSVPDG